MRIKYFNLYVQFKASSIFLHLLLKRYQFWNKFISGSLAVITSGSVTAWFVWKSVPLLWAVIVAVSQVVSIVKGYIPFLEYIAPLKYLLPELEKMLIEMDYKWELINRAEYDDDSAINDLIYSCDCQWSSMQNKYMPGVSLANARLQAKADQSAIDFFSQRYPQKEVNEYVEQR